MVAKTCFSIKMAWATGVLCMSNFPVCGKDEWRECIERGVHFFYNPVCRYMEK
jgi:hypothetical protein